MGKMGSGKTLGTTFLACALAKIYQVPLFANYKINSERFILVDSRQQLMKIENGIIVLDEAHLFLDSRLWKEKSNITLTHWATKIRKKNLLVFVISQHIKQVDVRLRNLLDILIVCERLNTGVFKLSFLDWQYNTVGRSMFLREPAKLFYLYNTFEEVKALD